MAIREDMSKFQMQISSQNIENQFLQDDRKPKKSSRYIMVFVYAFACCYIEKTACNFKLVLMCLQNLNPYLPKYRRIIYEI